MRKETLDWWTKLLAVIGGLWSLVTIIAAVAVASSASWQQWLTVKACVIEGRCPAAFYSNNQEFVRYGEQVFVKVGNLYLRGTPESDAEKEVTVVEGPRQ